MRRTPQYLLEIASSKVCRLPIEEVKRLNLTKKGAFFLEWDECLKRAFGYVTFRWLLLRRMDQTLSKTDYIACYVDIIRGLIMCNDLKGTAHSAQDKF